MCRGSLGNILRLALRSLYSMFCRTLKQLFSHCRKNDASRCAARSAFSSSALDGLIFSYQKFQSTYRTPTVYYTNIYTRSSSSPRTACDFAQQVALRSGSPTSPSSSHFAQNKCFTTHSGRIVVSSVVNWPCDRVYNVENAARLISVNRNELLKK